MYYRECPHCGAALDPGEKCDCVNNTQPDEEKDSIKKELIYK